MWVPLKELDTEEASLTYCKMEGMQQVPVMSEKQVKAVTFLIVCLNIPATVKPRYFPRPILGTKPPNIGPFPIKN